MATVKFSAPVGLSPRQSPGKPVRNKPDDVLLLCNMLAANRIALKPRKSMDAGLLKAIAVYQKKIGFRTPDQVVDPGGKTFKALLPKYQAALRAAEKVKLVEVDFRGSRIRLTVDEHKKMTDEVFKKLDGYIGSLLRNHKQCLETYQDYLDTAMMKDGVLDAVAQAIVITAGSVRMPSDKIVGRSIKAAGQLEIARKKKDIKLLNTALPEAERAINGFNGEILRFLGDFTGSAQTTITVLNVTSASCFVVVGVLAAPVLVTGAGMSAGAAAVTSGAGVSILQSASAELGKHASGQKVTVWDSVRAVTVDGTVGALTAGIAKKIPLKFCDRMARAVAPKLASRVPFMATKQLEKFIANYLAGAGQESIKSAIGEAVKLIGSWMKKGKVPTEKEFDAAVSSILYSLLLGGVVRNLGSFQKKWAYANKSTLQGKILPDRFARLPKSNRIPNVIKAKMYADVMNKVGDTALKAGFDGVIAHARGTESPAELTKMAERSLMGDKKLQRLIDSELARAMKKYKVPAQ